MLDNLKEVKQYTDNYLDRFNELSNQISEVDGKINDIIHYIEFTPSLNAVGGYKLYRLLKDHLEERREIKNEFEDLQSIRLRMEAIEKEVSRAIGTIDYRQKRDRKYRVRQLEDLFGEYLEKEEG